MTDIVDTPILEPEPDIPPKPDPIEFTPIPDAEGLPDDVKNGEIPEDDPTINHEAAATEENR